MSPRSCRTTRSSTRTFSAACSCQTSARWTSVPGLTLWTSPMRPSAWTMSRTCCLGTSGTRNWRSTSTSTISTTSSRRCLAATSAAAWTISCKPLISACELSQCLNMLGLMV
uniref:Uncharacterized protein n=1 Tax=Zea mays TaxID=4577 RepID=B8A240_MAIZE|nr:unknown [Zea mays]